MPKIKKTIPGETYHVRQWDDMRAEYGLTSWGGIECSVWSFMPEMKYLCGSVITAPQVLGHRGWFEIPRKDDPDDTWIISPHMLEPAPQNMNGDD